MKRRRIVLAVLLAAILFPSACHKETEEDRVRKVLLSVQKAAEGKKILTVLEHLSKSYHDPQGNDYDGIKGLLAYYFFRHRSVAIYIPSFEIRLDEQGAQARFEAVLSGRGAAEEATPSVLPEALGVYDFDVNLVKEEGRWKIRSAAWTRTGEAGPQPPP